MALASCRHLPPGRRRYDPKTEGSPPTKTYGRRDEGFFCPCATGACRQAALSRANVNDGPKFGYRVASLVLALGMCGAGAVAASVHNSALRVVVQPDGSYEVLIPHLAAPVLRADIGAEIDHHWFLSGNYPEHRARVEEFHGRLGGGRIVRVSFSGLTSTPVLICNLRLYRNSPFGEIDVTVRNNTKKAVTIQAIRVVEALGKTNIQLGAPASRDRILSDSFSEDDPKLRIYNLGAAPGAIHLGVGSQLIYNRQSHESLFLGALTSRRFLTILRLQAQRKPGNRCQIASFTVDSTGTTEVERIGPMRDAPADSLIPLNYSLSPGREASSERVMFAAGTDYHAQLEEYGRAIRVLHHARVSRAAPMGWWSWTAFYSHINEDAALTNARWLGKHLKGLGFTYFHIDEGYDYARGQYTTPDLQQFPKGMAWLGRQVAALGLKLGVWTAPFEVSARSSVYRNHRNWLVRDARGKPLEIGGFHKGQQGTYVLDTTNPAAQKYLRQTYRTMVRDWGVKYIKLDFMESTSVEGYYHRPNTTALEAERIGLEVIREAVGNNVLLDKDGSPMLAPVGLVDEGRISVDTGHSFWASEEAEPGIAARYYMNRNWFVSDPDAFTVSRQSIYDHSWPNSATPLTLKEAQVSVVLAALAGGMYEIGDDLLTLGADPKRLALAENPDLLSMVRLGRSATPVDLMSYRNRDEQPSIFLLHENSRVTMLAVFNWTEQPRSHVFNVAGLGLPAGRSYHAYDVLDGNQPIPVQNGALRLEDQPRHSVKLIKLIDDSAVRLGAPPGRRSRECSE